jgi:hypothetical protein
VIRRWKERRAREAALNEIERLTDQLRHTDELYWADLRELLRERGVAPESTLVVDSSPDEDTDLLAVVLDSGRAVEIEYSDRHRVPGREPELTRWIDIATGSPEWSLYHELVELALEQRAAL